MLLLLSALAAGSSGGLPGTADTLSPGEVVLRVPTGTSAVGLTEESELWVVPYELWTGGTRLGVEYTVLSRDAVSLSLSPSVSEKWTLRRTALRLEGHLSVAGDRRRLTLSAAPQLRLMRQEQLSETLEHDLSIDRLHVPVTLTADATLGDSLLRARLTVAALDEGVPMTYGVLAGGLIRRLGRLHLDVGAGVLVGRPSEQVFLGTYHHRLVAAYPRMDLWVLL